jgi:hypothetical protein
VGGQTEPEREATAHTSLVSDSSCLSDTNECIQFPFVCPRDKPVCVNTYGSYRCRTNKRCSRGYEPNEDGTACVGKWGPSHSLVAKGGSLPLEAWKTPDQGPKPLLFLDSHWVSRKDHDRGLEKPYHYYHQPEGPRVLCPGLRYPSSHIY